MLDTAALAAIPSRLIMGSPCVKPALIQLHNKSHSTHLGALHPQPPIHQGLQVVLAVTGRELLQQLSDEAEGKGEANQIRAAWHGEWMGRGKNRE
jgi:hypothetical protein